MVRTSTGRTHDPGRVITSLTNRSWPHTGGAHNATYLGLMINSSGATAHSCKVRWKDGLVPLSSMDAQMMAAKTKKQEADQHTIGGSTPVKRGDPMHVHHTVSQEIFATARWNKYSEDDCLD